MCNAVSTSKWQVQKNWENSPRRQGAGWEGPKEAASEIHRKCCDSDASSMQRVAGIKSNFLWCTLDISSSHSTSRLSSVSYKRSYRYRQCACVCSFLFSRHSSICYPLFCFVSAPSVLSENLLFFYRCESGWCLICWKKDVFLFFCGFCQNNSDLFSPNEKGWNLKGGQGYKRHMYHLVLTGGKRI